MTAAPSRRLNAGSGLVARHTQSIRLAAALDQAFHSRGTTVVIAGDVGTGKSRLAAETLRSAQARGFRVLAGTAAQMHEDVAFAVFLHLLRPALAGADVAERRRLTGGLPDLGRLFVELPADRLPPIADPGLERLRLLESVLVLVRRLSVTQPVVMLLDDVQWADPASLDLLLHLARGLSAEPVLLIACVRTEDGRRPGHLARLLDDARRSGITDEIMLPALEPGEVEQLCAAVLNGPAPTGLLDALTIAGVTTPLFVHEVVTTMIEQGVLKRRGGHWVVVGAIRTGPTIDEVMAGRLATLSGAARTALDWMVVAGESAVTVADHTGVPNLHAQWASLADRGFVTAGDLPGPPRVSHPLLAEVCYRSIPPGTRRRMHREVALALLGPDGMTGPHGELTGPGDGLGWIAHHVRLAGHEWPADSALQWITAAATGADRVSAPQTSAQMWSSAEQLARRLSPAMLPEILEKLARAHSRVGQIPAALTSWHEAVRLRAVQGDAVAQARIWGEMSMVVCDQGDPEQARSMLNAADAAVHRSRRRLGPDTVTPPPADVEALLAAEVTVWGLRVWIAGRHGDLPELIALSTALEGFRGHHPGAGAEAALHLLHYDIAARQGDLLEAEGHARLALSSATERGDAVAAGHARRQLHVSALSRGDFDTADRVTSSRDAARADGRRELVASPLTHAALRAFVTDDWVTADRSARSTIEFGLRIGSPRVIVPIMGYLAVIAVQQGRVPEAESLLAEAAETLGSGGGRDLHIVGVMHQAQALVDLTQGRAAAAVAAAERAAAIRGLLPAMTFVPWVLGLLDVGDVDRAREVAQDLKSIGPGPWPMAVSSWLSGRAALVDGEHHGAVALLAASRMELARLNMPYQAARSGLDEARALAAVGRADDAAARARQSASVFASYQARPLSDETRQLLSTLGHRIGGGRAGGPASSLSEREWDVVGLVAQGLSNAEVGRRLFISPRTVTTHLQHVYSKTGVTSRTALVRWTVDGEGPPASGRRPT